MIAPLRALWRQFTGSQANAIIQALWEYFHDTYDNTLEYWRKLSLDTAKSHHLTLMGIFQGIARPLLPIPDEDYLVFDEDWDLMPDPIDPSHMVPDRAYPSKIGFGHEEEFSGEENVGHFAEVKQAGRYSYLNDDMFRRILIANSSSTGMLGSLVALDDIVYALWRREHPRTPPVYTLTWAKVSGSGAQVGDLIVDLGSTGDWADPYEVAAELRLLGKTVYYPVPKVVSRVTVGDGVVDPIGLIRILLRTDRTDPLNIVYGLNDMWAGNGTPSDYVDDGEEPEWAMSALTNGELGIMFNTDGQVWVDDPDPSEEFIHVTEDELATMWL